MTLKHELLILALLISINTFSQERKIIGRIHDSVTKKNLSNASIVILGTTSGTFSNYLGFFELQIDSSKHKTLIISHIGFKTTAIVIPSGDRFKLSLEREYVPLSQINLNLYPRNPSNEHKPEVPKTQINNGFIIVESSASFPTGMDNFYDLIGNSLTSELPQVNETGFNITFSINESGQAVDIVTSDSTESVTNAVRKAFQKMPDWIPATQRENKTPQHFILPIIRTDIHDLESFDLKDFYSFISRNIKYPTQAKRMGIEGALFAEFEVDSIGNTRNIRILKDMGAGCGDEVRRIIASTPPEFTKSLFNKTHINKFILPVSFGLDRPFKHGQFTSNSDAVVLHEVAVTTFGVERKKEAADYPTGFPRITSFTLGTPSDDTYHSLGNALNKPKSVKRLSLVNNGLNSFPSEILQLNNLEFLDLERNELQKLPKEIESLTKLKELYLFQNQMESLPLNFGNLKGLKILGLAHNKLKSFPPELAALEKLEALDLSNNQITSIPPAIGAMKNLKFLILQNNNISNIPMEFYQLKKLEKIYIQGNPIDPKDIELLKTEFRKAEILFSQ